MPINLPRIIIISLFVLFQGLLFGQFRNIELRPSPIDNTIGNLYSEGYTGDYQLSINGKEKLIHFNNGYSDFKINSDEAGRLFFIKDANTKPAKNTIYHISNNGARTRIKRIPMWMSLIPPLVAIGLALLLKEVIISLFMGIWAGVFVVGGLRYDSLYYFIKSFLEVVQKYIIQSLNSSSHLSVIIFSLMIGGMVAIISKNGGMAGIVDSLSKYAKNSKSSQVVTWFLGVAIFFDDYANTLIVGNTMRSVTDKFRISREKLAYIVDSTAAPVSAVAFITTWIGAELSYIQEGITDLSLHADATPYLIFIQSLKYSFYPILTLGFILLVIYTGRDFGPMLKAEKRARTTGQVSPAATDSEDEPDMEDLSPVKGASIRWYNAFIPVMLVIFVTLLGLLDTGLESIHGEIIDNIGHYIPNTWAATWHNLPMVMSEGDSGFFMRLGKIIGASDSYQALLWASMTGMIAAIVLTVSQGIMKLFDCMHWMVTGFKTMLPALVILTMAWALAILTKELHTADFLSTSLQGNINPYILPMIVFILSFLIAFSTGSSWSTMAILYPIAIPLSWAISQSYGMEYDISYNLLLNSIASVLAASVLGDHCSPISDTTILSSLASDCNHIDHVKTQMPYALTVGFFSVSCVGLSAYIGGGWLTSIIMVIVSFGMMYFILMKFGKKVE